MSIAIKFISQSLLRFGRQCVGSYVPGAFVLLLTLSVQAQETGAVESQDPGTVAESLEAVEAEPQEVVPELLAINALPEVSHLAAALSDRSSRTDTLLTMISVVRLLESASPGGVPGPDSLQARFRDDRGWLDRLARRYPGLPVRGSQLDPAAWLMTFQLSLHQETPGLAVSPLGPEDVNLMRALFNRSNERLAAAVLPEVLQRIETQSPALWAGLIESVSVNGTLHAAMSGLYADWFHPWVIIEQPDVAVAAAVKGKEVPTGVVDDALIQVRKLAGSVMFPGPVDEDLLLRLRFGLLSALPTLDADGYRDAGYLLALSTALDGLQDNKYLAFTESLLWIVSDMLLHESISPVIDLAIDQESLGEAGAEPTGEVIDVVTESAADNEAEAEVVVTPGSPVAGLLSELLPSLSNTFAGEFSEVDPRINASLATAFNSAQYLQGNFRSPARLTALRQNMGDAIAQLVLQIPDMGYYFDQPVRRRIAEEIDRCTGDAGQPGSPAFSREQFDGCMSNLVEMAASQVNKEELSGDSDGPFGPEQLSRELMMPPWQRINFSLGYLHDRFPTACRLPEQPLPNPLEWSSLATVFTWLARQAPMYFHTPENEALLLKLRQQGLDLLRDMVQQVDCFSGEGSGVNDPIRRSLANYRFALDQLVAGIREAELAFRAEKLKPGADVVLHGDAMQQTAYRTEGLLIGPCDIEQICEMSGKLEATRALIGLFPDAYLIADQTGLGSIEICYQNVQWVNRRAVPVRPEDTHVANFFGQLSFDLVGRFRENGKVSEVFGSNFISPDEYHYLFAAATDEVRDDNCPTEWVGSRIVTALGGQQSVRVVPDRLTYLAGARKKPSQVIEANWSKGAEWRDWFVTGLGVTPYEFPPDESISGRVNQYLAKLYQAEQAMIYAALLRPQSRVEGLEAVEPLLDLQEELTARKALVRSYMNLFYPDSMLDSDELRGSLVGNSALIDYAILRRFQDANVAASSINVAGLSRLEQFQSDWNQQPEILRRSGSIASGVAHSIIRLNALYREFFALPAKKTEPRDEAISPAAWGG